MDQPQLWAVVFIIAGAAGYLALALRRSLRGQDACCGTPCFPKPPDARERGSRSAEDGSPEAPGSPTGAPPAKPQPQDEPSRQVFIPLEHLTAIARERRREHAASHETQAEP